MSKNIEIETTKKPVVGKRFYNDADDKNVAVNLVFAAEDGSLSYDEEGANKVPASDCLKLFVQGVVALKNNTYYMAQSCTTEGVIDFGF